MGRDKWGLSGVRTSAGRGHCPPSMAAVKLSDFPRVRQLLKVCLTTVILDEASWRAYEDGSGRAGEAHDAEAVRAALR